MGHRSMKRYIAQFKPWSGGLYVVLDTDRDTGGVISDPMPYHKANDEAHARNAGTYIEGMTWEAMAEALQAAFPGAGVN